jgi:hypothetical protein
MNHPWVALGGPGGEPSSSERAAGEASGEESGTGREVVSDARLVGQVEWLRRVRLGLGLSKDLIVRVLETPFSVDTTQVGRALRG